MNTATQAAIALELQQACCVFGTQKVLWNLDLRVRQGETLVIVGESGCGKSVTMKVMMKLLQPTSGRLIWFGQRVDDMSPETLHQQRLRLGYLFQGAALFDSLSIFENVAFGLRHTGETDEDRIAHNVHARLAEVGLSEDVVSRFPSEISGGMQKRVGLARALALGPDVMFYDEPTTGLDPVNSRRIDELILSVRELHGVTGIIVTHDLRTVQRVADRIVMLYPRSGLHDDDSQTVFDGTLDELAASSDERVREYIGNELDSTAGRRSA